MITRIVKLEFREDKIEEFISFFDTIKNVVNDFPGCNGMILYNDLNKRSTFMTYSQWDSQDSLNAYRNSEAFGEIWPKIKPWFNKKPEAWTLYSHFDGFKTEHIHGH